MAGNPNFLLIQGCSVAAISVFLLVMAAMPKFAVADLEQRGRIISANPSIAIADLRGQASSGFHSRGFPSTQPTRVTQGHNPGHDAHAFQVAQGTSETPRELELLKRLMEGLIRPREPQDPGQAQPPAEPGQTQPPAEPGQAQPPAEPGQAQPPGQGQQPPPAEARKVVSPAEAVEILTRLKHFHDNSLIDPQEYEEAQIRVISGIDFPAMGAKDGLRFLRGLKDQGLITETVYAAKKQEILAVLTGPGSSPQAQPPSAQQTPPANPTAGASPNPSPAPPQSHGHGAQPRAAETPDQSDRDSWPGSVGGYDTDYD